GRVGKTSLPCKERARGAPSRSFFPCRKGPARAAGPNFPPANADKRSGALSSGATEKAMTPRELLREVVGVILLGLGAFALLSLASFDAGDYAARSFPRAESPSSWGGASGAALA